MPHRLLLPLVGLSLIGVSLGCRFDCAAGSLCGGAVHWVNRSYSSDVFWDDSMKEFAVNGGLGVVLNTLNLSGRGITSLAPGGLECFFAQRPVTPAIWGFISAFNGSATQAVLLDRNLLRDMPNLSAVVPGVAVVSIRDNFITALPRHAFVLGCAGCSADRAGLLTGMLSVDLQGNAIDLKGLSPDTFTGPTTPCGGLLCRVEYMKIRLAHNAFAGVLPSNVFRGFTNVARNLDVDLQWNNLTSYENDSFPPEPFLSELQVLLGFNKITTFVPIIATPTGFANGLVIQLQGNAITEFPSGAFSPTQIQQLTVDMSQQTTQVTVADGAFAFPGGENISGSDFAAHLSSNGITAFAANHQLANFGTGYLVIDLSNNSLTSLGPTPFSSFAGQGLTFLAANNSLAGALPDIGLGKPFVNATGGLATYFKLDLSTNMFTSLGRVAPFAGVMVNELFVALHGNAVSGALPNGSLQFGGQTLVVDLSSNTVTGLGAIFPTTSAAPTVITFTVNLSHNLIGADSLVPALNSMRGSIDAIGYASGRVFATTEIDLSHNNITWLPPNMFSAIHNPPLLTVDLHGNPLTSIHPDAFSAIDVIGASSTELSAVVIDLSNSTAGPLQVPASIAFGNITWSRGASFILDLSGTDVDLGVVNALSEAAPSNVTVRLKRNHDSAVPADAFNRSLVTTIDLSGNCITDVSAAAFPFSTVLQGLDLSDNNLTSLSIDVSRNTPVLSSLVLRGNQRLWALPQDNNHVFSAAAAAGSTLRCATYGPTATECSCARGFVLSVFCGYVRCTLAELTDGCANGTIFNSSNCALAPQSACVRGEVAGQYYNAAIKAFLRISNCSTAFPLSQGSTAYIPAYQVIPPHYNAHATATSDRYVCVRTSFASLSVCVIESLQVHPPTSCADSRRAVCRLTRHPAVPTGCARCAPPVPSGSTRRQ
jgi:hypothetical protein